MPKRQVETAIGGVKFRMTQLGANTIAELGDQVTEATALTGRGVPALAGSIRAVREAILDASFIAVVDEADPAKKSKWVELRTVFDDHFAGARSGEMGMWFAWAVKECGLPHFLGGGLKGLVPSLLAKLPSAFQPAADGSPIDSSSAKS